MSRPADPLAEINLLDLAPQRLAGWSELDGRVLVERPPPRGRGLRRLGPWLSYRLSVRKIRLDEVGSVAWRQLDGRTTVAEVAAVLRRQFGDSVEPVEERLGQLVRLLRREGLLAYPGWDEAG